MRIPSIQKSMARVQLYPMIISGAKYGIVPATGKYFIPSYSCLDWVKLVSLM